MNGPWASLLRVWVLNDFCFAIPSKVVTTRVLHHTRRALCLTCHPNRHSKVQCAVVCNHSTRKLKLLDSINVDTAVAEYAGTGGSIKRVGRCICFHQACTPGVCEAFLVVLELRFTSDPSNRLYPLYIYLEYCILFLVIRRPCPDLFRGFYHLCWVSGLRNQRIDLVTYRRGRQNLQPPL